MSDITDYNLICASSKILIKISRLPFFYQMFGILDGYLGHMEIRQDRHDFWKWYSASEASRSSRCTVIKLTIFLLLLLEKCRTLLCMQNRLFPWAHDTICYAYTLRPKIIFVPKKISDSTSCPKIVENVPNINFGITFV